MNKIIPKIALLLALFPYWSVGAMDPRTSRQILLDIDTTLTTCCSTVEINFEGTFTTITVLTTAVKINDCSSQLITQEDIGTTGLTIITPGLYKLTENITFNPLGSAAAITINSDNVILDLQCYLIVQENLTANVDGVAIAPNHSNIMITGGKIKDFSRDGIRVDSGCSNLEYTNITIQNCQYGIFCLGTNVSPIEILRAAHLDLLSNSTAVSLTFVNRADITNVTCFDTTHGGFELVSSFSNSIDSCSLERTNAPNGSAVGISLLDGGNNRVENCFIDGVSTTDTFSGNSAVGILIGATENDDLITRNQISNCTTTSSAQPLGIEMLYTFTYVTNFGLPSETLIDFSAEWSSSGRYIAGVPATGIAIEEFANNNTLKTIVPLSATAYRSLDWSPNDQFIVASRLSGRTIDVLLFDGASLSVQTTIGPIPGSGPFTSCSWSPNGSYIALGGSGGPGSTTNLALFKFSGNVLQLLSLDALLSQITAVQWSPDGSYLAACGVSSVATNIVYIYRLVNNLLVQVASFTEAAAISTLAWSPNGQFLATGSTVMRIFRFSGSSLVPITTATTGVAINSIDWSPDGNYIANASSASTLVNFYSFDNQNLNLAFTYDQGATLNRVRWNRNGAFLFLLTVPNTSSVVTGFQLPSGTLLQNNEVSTIRGPSLPSGQPGVSSGRGLSASSANNLILQNTSFDVDLSYVFANNLFQQFITNSAQQPNLLSNVFFPPL